MHILHMKQYRVTICKFFAVSRGNLLSSNIANGNAIYIISCMHCNGLPI